MTTPLRLLCVDDDKDFINYLLSVSEDFNISVDISETLASAFGKLAAKSYDAFIVDLKLPDGSGFDLVEKIRAKGNFPIAVISGAYQDETSFRLLKEKFKIDYVLSKPVYQHHFTKLISQICNRDLVSLENSLDKPAQELATYYQSTICNKIDTLSSLIEAVQTHADTTSLSALKDALHKIAGSAGSYGYHEVTKICKELEQDIRGKLGQLGGSVDKSSLSDNKSVRVSVEWLDSLNAFLKEIKYYFQVPTPNMSSIAPSQEKIEGIRNVLYVLDYDEEFLNLLEREKERFGINLVSETDPGKGKERLLSPDFHPRITLISETFPGSTFTGLGIFEEMRKSPNYLPTVCGLVLKSENLDVRLDAAKNGVKYVFCKPVSPNVILESMSNELGSTNSKNLKILILDDDENVCKYVENAFNDLGIDVKILNDPSELYKTLESYSPHVLLLDILLPKYDGLDLLKVLRSDPIYRDLIIVVITHYTDLKAKEMAYANRANDILYKPLEKSVLQVRILELVKHQIQSGGSLSDNLRLGLDTYSDLISKLHSCLLKSSFARGCLVFFEIDKFSDFILQENRSRTNHLLITISNILIGIANQDISCFYIGDSKFAMYVENKDLAVVENRVYERLKSIIRESDTNISISCGIVPVTKTMSSVQKLIAAAEQSLLEARNQEEISPVKIVIYADKSESKSKREVLLVDPDVELLKMTKMALESQGLNVKTFTNGEDALSAIFHHQETDPPALIISERKIPDMDGMEFFNRVKARYHVTIPFYFLTAYSSDQDISEGLREGALQYITKPFNMSLLVQRVIQTVQGE